jgi:addiction module HigA family antidote
MTSNIRRVTTHPGYMLYDEFIDPMGISIEKMAEMLGVPDERLFSLIRQESSIDIELARRLSNLLGMSTDFWMNLQNMYDTSKSLTGKSKERKNYT